MEIKPVIKLIKFFLNIFIWMFLITLIIDLYLYLSKNKLISDQLMKVRRKTNDHLRYFVYYFLSWILFFASFGILLIFHIFYIWKNNYSFIEKITSTRTVNTIF